MQCPAVCNNVALLKNPANACFVEKRKTTLSRVAFFLCSGELPDPLPENIKPLFDDGTIVVSSVLGNIVINDPTTSDEILDECSPADRNIDSREIVFEDRVAVTASQGSPAVENDYYDYDWWEDKYLRRTSLRTMLIYCNGDVYIPTDRTGNFLPFSLLVTKQYQKPSTAGGAWTEFKRISLIYSGDPMSLHIKPAFNLIEEGIDL